MKSKRKPQVMPCFRIGFALGILLFVMLLVIMVQPTVG